MNFCNSIYETLSKLPYGLWDNSKNRFMTKSQQNDPDYVDKHMRVQTPQEVIKRGGNCWDMDLCIAYYSHQRGLDYQFIFTERPSGTHSFCLVNEGGKWYHIEPADGENMGVHGPFISPSKAVDNYKRYLRSHGERNVRIINGNIEDFWSNNNLSSTEFLRRFNSRFIQNFSSMESDR